MEATSYVGHVQLGSLRITVKPKLRGAPLLRLLRYAYGLRDLELQAPVDVGVSEDALLDLLILQLVAEVGEMLSRGLHRSYIRKEESLTSPRGRIDMQRYAAAGWSNVGLLPCVHYARVDDCLLNQVLLAGLRRAARLASDPTLRVQVLRTAALLDGSVSRIMLSAKLLSTAEQAVDRRTVAYLPAVQLITLLCEGQGSELEDGGVRVPGFLFDMNRFFQRLLGRLISDHLAVALPGLRLAEEHMLRELLRYAPRFNPRRHRAPAPRPDFVVLRGGAIMAIMDAKYRDLWEKPLPREMLYQLAVYTLSQPSTGGSAILYPTMDEGAREARIEIREPVQGAVRGFVALRPVVLPQLDRWLRDQTKAAEQERVQLVRRFVLASNV